MSNIKAKSEENFRAAQLLANEEHKMFSSSIHCAYYSSLLLIKHILKHFCCKEYSQYDNVNKDSHNLLINDLTKDLESKSEIIRKVDLNKNFKFLKCLRVKADYRDTIISQKESEEAIEKTIEVRQILEKVYK